MQRRLRPFQAKLTGGMPTAPTWHLIPTIALAAFSLLSPNISGAQTQKPLSAIDWLTVQKDKAATSPIERSNIAPQKSLKSVEHFNIGVTSLDAPSDNRIGLLPSKTTGLPYDLWGTTPEPQLAQAVLNLPELIQPALSHFQITLLLAETAPPLPATPSQHIKNASQSQSPPHQLFRARIATLFRLGALEQARALLEQANLGDPQNFAQWFDSALLVGDETQACARMTQNSQLAPSPQARIFCFARSGDWAAAALILRTGSLLGDISPDQQDLLWAFLDPERIGEADSFQRPLDVTPLQFKLFASIGEALPTHTLPLLYAHADLTSSRGLKTQLEAAERLAKHNKISPEQLLSLYTERKPSASGGVWTRAKAAQTLLAVLTAKEFKRAADELERIWPMFINAGLATPLAEALRDPLKDLYLNTQSPHALLAGLLTSDYEAFARLAKDNSLSEQHRLLVALALDETNAQGNSSTSPQPLSPLALAILDAFTGQLSPPPQLLGRAKDQLGLSLLNTLEYFDTSRAQEPQNIAQGLAFLRHLGLDNLARQTALQTLILKP